MHVLLVGQWCNIMRSCWYNIVQKLSPSTVYDYAIHLVCMLCLLVSDVMLWGCSVRLCWYVVLFLLNSHVLCMHFSFLCHHMLVVFVFGLVHLLAYIAWYGVYLCIGSAHKNMTSFWCCVWLVCQWCNMRIMQLWSPNRASFLFPASFPGSPSSVCNSAWPLTLQQKKHFSEVSLQ